MLVVNDGSWISKKLLWHTFAPSSPPNKKNVTDYTDWRDQEQTNFQATNILDNQVFWLKLLMAVFDLCFNLNSIFNT